ncbi:MAG: AbrB/MazE/SpoVT family DNA-binding domain-containing protein [Xanthomonadaceae bacterium]|nr:AbrB/MazE/SpoVT family DNA-binding domain-containing protein [Xanthomonadaceae bacterium]
MSKVTSKLQLTLPKRLAEQFGIKPGDEVEFQAAGDCIRLVPAGGPASAPKLSREERLRLFDEDTAWQQAREKRMPEPTAPYSGRGWSRAELYDREKPR